MSKYDIIIIGSGLGGLECGAILSKEGFNVCVVERMHNSADASRTYQRKENLFDTGIHYVGSLDEGQVMNQYFRYFGIMDKLKVRRLDDTAFDTIYYKGKSYDYAMGYPQFIETLCQSFPHEKEHLKRYAAELQAVGNLISVDHLKQGTIARRNEVFLHFGSRADRRYNPRSDFTKCTGRFRTTLWRSERCFHLLPARNDQSFLYRRSLSLC